MTALKDEIAIPRTTDEVDAAWLTSILERDHPGVVVTEAVVTDSMIGACVKLRVALRYNAAGVAAGLPATLIVKGNFGRQGPELDFMFEGEMRSYRDVIGASSLTSPRCYFAGGAGGATMLLLEDLATPDCIFGAVARPLSFDEASLILAQLAQLHATYWNHPGLAAGGELGWFGETLSAEHFAFLLAILEPAQWAHYRTLPRGVAAPRGTAGDSDRIAAALRKQQAFHRTVPQTLCHGDSHGANIYFNHRGGGLFDWFLRRGPWFHDVTYFITGTLDVVDRRRWEWALLKYYLDCLASHGIDAPSLDEAIACYRRELIFGYVLMIGNGESDAYWSETAITAAAVRFAMAAEDHRMLDAIEQGR